MGAIWWAMAQEDGLGLRSGKRPMEIGHEGIDVFLAVTRLSCSFDMMISC
jgi:hypothetical protein